MTEAQDNAEAGPSQPRQRQNDTSSENEWYPHHLEEHVRTSRRLYSGKLSIGARNVVQLNTSSSTVYPYHTIWTQNEKRLFFAALCRHSRHCPELMAKDVGTKSEAEIQAYLDNLEYGARRVARRDRNEGRWRDRSDRWNRAHRWVEGTAPATREVSGDWVEKEEGLATFVVRRAEEEEENVFKRFKEERRKSERKQARKDSVVDAKDIRSHRSAKVVLDELSRQWRAEDWGERLGPEGLKAVSRLLRLSVSSSNRVQVKAEEQPSNAGQTHGASLAGTTTTTKCPTAIEEQSMGPVSKYDKIAQDEVAFERLSKIPKRTRTSDVKLEFAALLNRRRNRKSYRQKKLLKEGMTEEDIEEQGGVDAIMAIRAGKGATPAQSDPSGNTDGMHHHTRTVDIAERSPLRKNAKNCSDGIQKLKEAGAIEYLTEKGWELFSFETLTILSTSASSNEIRRPDLSFEILDLLYRELLSYLKPLVLQSVLIAEQDQLAADGHANATSTNGTLGGGEISGVALHHVHQALALRDERLEDPTFEVDERDENEYQTDEQTSLEKDVGQEERGRLRLRVAAPGSLDWAEMPLADINDTVAEEVETEYDPDSDLSDKEDVELDQAMDEMDTAYDDLLEHDLLTRGINEGRIREDWDDPFALADKSQPTKSSDRLQNELLAQAKRARDDYQRLSTEIHRLRRYRHSIQLRSRIFPTMRLKKLGGKMRANRSRAYVIESEEGGDQEDQEDQEEEEREFGAI